MASRWFYKQKDGERGPVDSATLKELAQNGVLKPDTFIREDGSADWRPAGEAKGLFRSPPQQGTPAEQSPAASGGDSGLIQSSEALKYRCTNCNVTVTGDPIVSERGSTIECPVCANQIPAWPRPEEPGLIGQRTPHILTPQPLEPQELSKLLDKLATYSWDTPHVADVRFPSQVTVTRHSLVPIFRITHLIYVEERTAIYSKRQLQYSEQPVSTNAVITKPDPWEVPLAEYPYGRVRPPNSTSFTEVVPVPETGEYKKCGSCHAVGVVSCPGCGGSGKKKCARCEGRRLHKCRSCGGTGQERIPNTVQELATCSRCGGSGMKGAFAARMAKEMDRTLVCEACYGRGQRMQSVDRSYRVPCGGCSQTGQVRCQNCDSDGKVRCEQCDSKGKVKCKECDGNKFLYWWWAVERKIEQLKEELDPWWDKTHAKEVPDEATAVAGLLNDAGQARVVWKEGSPSASVLHRTASKALPKELVHQRLGHLKERSLSLDVPGKPTGHELVVETLCCASAFYLWQNAEEFCVWSCGGLNSVGTNANPLNRAVEQRLVQVREKWGEDGSSLSEADKQECVRAARISSDIAKKDTWLKETAAFSGLPPNLKSLADTEAWVIFGDATLKRSVGAVKEVASSIGKWLGGLWRGEKKGGS